MLTFFSTNLLWTQGGGIAFGLFMLALMGLFYFRPLFYCSMLLFVFSLFFFRNPKRSCSRAFQDPSILVCPADGEIVAVEYDDDGRFDGYYQKVSIFLSPFDVHVNRIPMSGVIESINYTPGQFLMAFLPKSSELNERNDLIIKDTQGRTILIRQIAGTIARVINCWVRRGQYVKVCETFGMIRFGSRVDVLLPKNVRIAVGIGQKVYGGQTIFGYWMPF